MSEIVIKQSRPRVEDLLSTYASLIGADLPSYRNHVHRTITYAMHFLNCAPEFEQIVETALVYHDIGIWTEKTMAYLGPSEDLAMADNQKNAWGLDSAALREAIHWHHKVSKYSGPHNELVEACRKADWIDVSQGFIKYGIPKTAIRKVEETFPYLGFQGSLLRLSKELGGSTLGGGFIALRDILKL